MASRIAGWLRGRSEACETNPGAPVEVHSGPSVNVVEVHRATSAADDLNAVAGGGIVSCRRPVQASRYGARNSLTRRGGPPGDLESLRGGPS